MKWLFFVGLAFVACMNVTACGPKYVEYQQDDRLQEKFADIKPLVTKHCQRCHAGAPFLTSAAAFRLAAKPRIRNNSMPLRGSPESQGFDEVKGRLLAF